MHDVVINNGVLYRYDDDGTLISESWEVPCPICGHMMIKWKLADNTAGGEHCDTCDHFELW